MDNTPTIDGIEKVVSIFGYWPSFHDAEVIWLRLDRGDIDAGVRPSLEMKVHTWEMTSDIGLDGYYVLRNHVLVEFRFDGIDELSLEAFNLQNVLFGLEIKSGRDRGVPDVNLLVDLDPSFGLGGSFVCRTATVKQVERYDEHGRAQATTEDRQ